MSGRILTAIALVVIFASAGLAATLMFPGHQSGVRAAVFGALFCTLSAPIFTRYRRRSREGRR